jgi:hypothetical protein
MGERSRRHAHRESDHRNAAAPTRSASSDETDRPSATPANPLLDLQATAGNRAVTQLIVQRAPGDDAPVVTVPTLAEATSELAVAEAWLRFVALRGNAPVPTTALAQRYRSQFAVIQAGIEGPGPISAQVVADTAKALGGASATVARTVIGRIRDDHDRLLPKGSTEAYDWAGLALDRAEANAKGGPDTFEHGATQYDEAYILLSILASADDELRAATKAGYQIPKALAELPSEAEAQHKASSAGYANRSPNDQKLITPQDEEDLAIFIRHAVETINSMAGRRIADIARARRREADALWEAGNQQMAELRAILADKRRSAFMSGDDDALDDVSKALGEVAGAIEETRGAAAIITDRVDQLNAVVSAVSKPGKGIISLPAVPEGIGKVADKLVSANEKVKMVIELLDLAGPAKTELDGGLKYLKAVDLSLEGFASKSANPFITVYVGSYLSPGIKNCMASIGSIAGSISSSNRAAIETGEAARITNWNTEPGGEAMYIFLAAVFRMGGAAPLGNTAWEYLADHRGDLSAAVGVPMPRDRRAVPAWASANRQALWESFYGSTRPPR